MIVAGRQIRVFDPWVLLLWTVPVTIFAILRPDPIFPYQLDGLAYGVFGFPFAFGALSGASSGDNIISLAPCLIDFALVGMVLHAAGLALRAFVWPLLLLPVAILVPLFFWPLGILSILMIWAGNWGVNWWALGQLP